MVLSRSANETKFRETGLTITVDLSLTLKIVSKAAKALML